MAREAMVFPHVWVVESVWSVVVMVEDWEAFLVLEDGFLWAALLINSI